MKSSKLGRAALTMAGAALVLGATACNTEISQEKYKADEAKAMKEEADARATRRAGFAAECINAFKWRKAALASSGVSGIDVYTKHFRGEIEKALGDKTVPAANGLPELSKTSIDAYLDGAYDSHVKTKFAAGRDFDNDGKVTARERNAQGNMRVTACMQQAAEAGVGPLAGPDMTARMFKMDALRARLDKLD